MTATVQSRRVFVLVNPITSKELGRPVWFHYLHAIGPKTTTDPSERAEYATREDAERSPAFRHPLAVFDVVEATDLAVSS